MWEAGGRAEVHQREELGGRGTAPGELQGPRDWSIGVCEEQLQEWMGGLGGAARGVAGTTLALRKTASG